MQIKCGTAYHWVFPSHSFFKLGLLKKSRGLKKSDLLISIHLVLVVTLRSFKPSQTKSALPAAAAAGT